MCITRVHNGSSSRPWHIAPSPFILIIVFNISNTYTRMYIIHMYLHTHCWQPFDRLSVWNRRIFHLYVSCACCMRAYASVYRKSDWLESFACRCSRVSRPDRNQFPPRRRRRRQLVPIENVTIYEIASSFSVAATLDL